MPEMFPRLRQDGDVLEPVAVEDEQVGVYADPAFLAQEAGGGGGADQVGGRLHLGAQGELVELVAVHGPEEVGTVDDVHARR